MFLAGGGAKAVTPTARPMNTASRPSRTAMHTNDLHATLLALIGLDHETPTYPYGVRDFRPMDVAGKWRRRFFA